MVKREWKNRKKSVVIDFNNIRYYRYPDSKSHGKRCYYTCSNENKRKGYSTLHRDMWIAAYGSIPEGYDVHHKDGDFLNNTLENFELITRSEHAKEHWKLQPENKRNQALVAIKNAQKKAAEMWKNTEYRERRRKEIKENIQNRHFNCKCRVCGKIFDSCMSTSLYCSKDCKKQYANAVARNKNKTTYKEERICEVCGKTFKTNRYSVTKTCSPHCKNIKRGRTLQGL